MINRNKLGGWHLFSLILIIIVSLTILNSCGALSRQSDKFIEGGTREVLKEPVQDIVDERERPFHMTTVARLEALEKRQNYLEKICFEKLAFNTTKKKALNEKELQILFAELQRKINEMERYK